MFTEADVIVGDGTLVSIVSVYVFDAELPLPRESVATLELISTITVPSDEPLTTSKVYTVPDTGLKLLATGVPPFAVPVTVISPITKSDVESLKVVV